MPSTGNTPRQRWPSCENSTRWIGEWSSLTSKVMMVRAAIDAHVADDDRRRRCCRPRTRAVELAGQRGAQRIRRRVGGDDLHEIGAVRNRRRVPHEDGVAASPCAASSTPSRLRAGTARRRPGRRRSRRRPSRPASAAPSDTCAGRATTSEPGCALAAAAQLALRRRLIVEAGELRIAGRERLLEHDARRVHGDRCAPAAAGCAAGTRRSPTSAPGPSPLPVSDARATAGSAPSGW